MSDDDRVRSSGTGRLTTGVAWALLLLGLWLWGREVTDVRPWPTAPTTGDVAAVGRPADAELPPAHQPLSGALPQRVDIPDWAYRPRWWPAASTGSGAIDPPPYDQAGVVGWYGGGTRPGAAGHRPPRRTRRHRDAGPPSSTSSAPCARARRSGSPAPTARSPSSPSTTYGSSHRDGFDARQAYGARQSDARGTPARHLRRHVRQRDPHLHGERGRLRVPDRS